ncbi:MAG: hypothetical protein LRZ84_10525 [Desertifilum sp.]|nr:hypothetical protein [Desertifilum sp.]
MAVFLLDYSNFSYTVEAPSLLAALVTVEYDHQIMPDDCQAAYEIIKGYKQRIQSDVLSDLSDVCHIYRQDLQERRGDAPC